MSHSLLFIATLVILDLWYVITMCRVLTMRSNVVYGIATLVTMAALTIGLELGVPVTVRAILFGLPHAIALPLVCSVGPIDKRLRRVVLINLMVLGVEFVGSNMISLLKTLVAPENQVSTIDVTEIYVVSAPLLIPSYELFAAIARHIDRSGQPTDVDSDITIACLIAYIPFCTFALALYAAHPDDFAVAGIGLLCTLLSITFYLLTLWAAQQEAQLAHDLTERGARLRQQRHMLAEIGFLVESAKRMRQLRHDLANQIDVVEELSRQGRTAEAQRYLSSLRQRTRALAEGTGQAHE